MLCSHAIRKIIIYLNSHFAFPTLTFPSVAAAPTRPRGSAKRMLSFHFRFPLAEMGRGVNGTAPGPPGSARHLCSV